MVTEPRIGNAESRRREREMASKAAWVMAMRITPDRYLSVYLSNFVQRATNI